MHTQFDEKGKLFTPVITKKPIRVIIQTTTHLIHGDIHVKPEDRIKDSLTPDEVFLAITNATIFNSEGSEQYHCKFLTVNQAHIIWLIPDNELVETNESHE
jgi:hypothetical protein